MLFSYILYSLHLVRCSAFETSIDTKILCVSVQRNNQIALPTSCLSNEKYNIADY